MPCRLTLAVNAVAAACRAPSVCVPKSANCNKLRCELAVLR